MFQGDKTDNDHERISPNSVMPILSSQTEPSQRHGDSDLVRQLQEKERRIQYLELKIQQLTQDSATILVEHQYWKYSICKLLIYQSPQFCAILIVNVHTFWIVNACTVWIVNDERLWILNVRSTSHARDWGRYFLSYLFLLWWWLLWTKIYFSLLTLRWFDKNQNIVKRLDDTSCYWLEVWKQSTKLKEYSF